MQQPLQRVVRLRTHPQGLAEARRADRGEHELLEVDVAVGVRTAVQDVEARHRQHVGVGAADVPVERQVRLLGAGLRDRERRAEDRVGTQPGLAVGTVEVDQDTVDVSLVERLEAEEGVGDLALDIAHRGADALATEAVAAVAQLHRLVRPGAGAARDRGPAPGPAQQLDLHLDGGVAPGVQDLSGVDVDDAAHGPPLALRLSRGRCGRCDEGSPVRRARMGPMTLGRSIAGDATPRGARSPRDLHHRGGLEGHLHVADAPAHQRPAGQPERSQLVGDLPTSQLDARAAGAHA